VHRATVISVTLTFLAVAGCADPGSTTAASPAPSASRAADLAAEVPAALRQKGTLTIATDATYAPNEFFAADNKTIQGFDVDLGNALAQTLGLGTHWVNANFTGIIPGLAAGRYDLSMSSFTDTKARERTVDFVTYYATGTSIVVKAGNPAHLTTELDLCGKKAAAEKGTIQVDDITAASAACTAAGKPPLAGQTYPDQNEVGLAVSTGKADAYLADTPVGEYQVHQSGGRFALAGSSYDTAPYGIAIPKSGGSLKVAIRDALKRLIADGTYRRILDRWSLRSGAITEPVINGAQT
jgi:polar amino acid transport system substrate-binding protein